MIRDGAMDQRKVDAIFGLHIGPGDAHALKTTGPAASMRAPDRLTITVKGQADPRGAALGGRRHGRRRGRHRPGLQPDRRPPGGCRRLAHRADRGDHQHGGAQQHHPRRPDHDRHPAHLQRRAARRRDRQGAGRPWPPSATAGAAMAQAVFTQPYPVTYNDPALSAWVKPVLGRLRPARSTTRRPWSPGPRTSRSTGRRPRGVRPAGRPPGQRAGRRPRPTTRRISTSMKRCSKPA